MVTGQGDETVASEAFRLRASGYVVKDRKLLTLLPEVVSSALNERALRRAEERIRYNEETERALLNATTESLLLLDSKGTVLTANETAAARLGMSVVDMIGRVVYDYLPPEFTEEGAGHIASVFRTGTPRHFEFVWEDRHFNNVVHPVYDESGEIKRVALFSMDTTERKNAEVDLQKARDQLEERVAERTAQLVEINKELRGEIAVRKRIEDSLKTLSSQVRGQAEMLDDILSSSPDYFYLMDRRGKFIYANSTAARVLGLKQSSMEGKYWGDLGLPEEALRPLDIDREALLAAGEPRSGHIRLPTPEGKVDFEYTLSPIKSWDGETRAVVATLRDVGAERRTENEPGRLPDKPGEMAKLFDLVPASLIYRDMNDKVILWNSGAERLYGWDRSEVIGRPVRRLLETSFPAPVKEIDSNLLEHGTWEGHLVNTTSDGSEIEVHSIWTVARGEDGEPNAVLEMDRPT
jgi:PAS domain S-box-containing protein